MLKAITTKGTVTINTFVIIFIFPYILNLKFLRFYCFYNILFIGRNYDLSDKFLAL